MGLSEHALDANDEWCTPPALFMPMVWGWGGIDLDPFGHFTSKVPATERWTLPEKWAAADGLSDEEWTALLAAGYVEGDAQTLAWNGRVFANGPYSNVAWWLSRAADAAEQREAHVIGLIPVRPNNTWWDAYVWRRASAICWPRKRVTFEGTQRNGKKGVNAPFHVCLPYYGNEATVFGFMYEHIGHIQILRPQTLPFRSELLQHLQR